MENNIIYDLKGYPGKRMKVYKDRVIIKSVVTFTSIMCGTVSMGEKTIYYSDCIGLQYKKSSANIGFIQMETASGIMHDKRNNFLGENSFSWASIKKNEKMKEVADYINKQINLYKNQKNNSSANISSNADELKKFKELLDNGIITQEEFNEKKKQLLNL